MTSLQPFTSLRVEAERLGTVPYLLTSGADGRPHAIAVSVTWEEGTLSVNAGHKSLANAAARPLVSMMWPAPNAASYGLFVDGVCDVRATQVVITPTRAVLHRAGEAAPTNTSSCGSDCVPLLG